VGEKLVSQVSSATGLPHELIAEELDKLIHAAGIQRDSVTLEDLRRILSDYVQDILVQAQAAHSSSDRG
jgi:hypothetical protein